MKTNRRNKINKGNMVNNEAIVRAHITSSEAFRIYNEKFDITESEQVDIDEMMIKEGLPGHYFAIKFPPFEGAYIVFKEMLPTMHPAYAALKYGFPGAIHELLKILPPYRLLILDLLDGKEAPSDESISAVMADFLKLWVEINVLDEMKIQAQIHNVRGENENTATD